MVKVTFWKKVVNKWCRDNDGLLESEIDTDDMYFIPEEDFEALAVMEEDIEEYLNSLE